MLISYYLRVAFSYDALTVDCSSGLLLPYRFLDKSYWSADHLGNWCYNVYRLVIFRFGTLASVNRNE